ERAHAGEAVDHVGRRQLPLEVAVHHLDQIVDLAAVGGDFFGPPFIGNIGGADQRQIVLVGVDEDDTLVVVLDQIGLPALPEFRYDHVAALNQPDVAGGVLAGDALDDVVDPWSRRIGECARLHGRNSTAALVAHVDR